MSIEEASRMSAGRLRPCGQEGTHVRMGLSNRCADESPIERL